MVLAALAENGKGTLTAVDNFFDCHGQRPAHLEELQRASPSWNLLLSDETQFLRNGAGESFDFFVSDGDHTRGYHNSPDVFRLCTVAGMIVFHDTNSPLFRLLGRVPARCRQLGFPAFQYTARVRMKAPSADGWSSRRIGDGVSPWTCRRACIFFSDRISPKRRQLRVKDHA